MKSSRRIGAYEERKRKRKLPLSIEKPSTRKISVAPIYSNIQKRTTQEQRAKKGLVLSLPAVLGRRNLAECWWDNCPNECNATSPQAIPCQEICSPVRRKRNREAISKSMVEIDATGQVRITARHQKLVDFRDEYGEQTRCIDISSSVRHVLTIGPEQPDAKNAWMKFRIKPIQVVTPEQPRWIETARKENKRSRRFLQCSLSDSPDRKRELFCDDSSSAESSSQSEDPSPERWAKRPISLKEIWPSTRGEGGVAKDGEQRRGSLFQSDHANEMSNNNNNNNNNNDSEALNSPSKNSEGDRVVNEQSPMESFENDLCPAVGRNKGATSMRASLPASGDEDSQIAAIVKRANKLFASSDRSKIAFADSSPSSSENDMSITLAQSTQAAASTSLRSNHSRSLKSRGTQEDVPLRQPSYDHAESNVSAVLRKQTPMLSLPLDDDSSLEDDSIHKQPKETPKPDHTGKATNQNVATTSLNTSSVGVSASTFASWTLDDWKSYQASKPESTFRRALVNRIVALNADRERERGERLVLPSLLPTGD